MRHVLVAIAVMTTACSTEPDTERVVGIIDADPSIPTIVAPDTVQAGVRFAATVNTFGSSSCTTPDGVDLTLEAATAHVTPYDRVLVNPDDGACSADMAPQPHPVDLLFTAPGEASIVVEGRVFTPTSNVTIPGTVTKAVVVLP
jgi:hypothetical protein